MSNSLYPKWKEALLQGTAASDLDGSGTTGVYCALVDTGIRRTGRDSDGIAQRVRQFGADQ